MDTLSSSVSTLKVPSLPEFHHFKRTPYATPTRPPHPQPHVSSSSIPTFNFFPKTKSFSQKSPNSPLFPSPLKLKPSSSPTFHQNQATGYAAAILDVAQNSNSLHSVQQDVHRLLKLLQNVNFSLDSLDPSAVKNLVEKGNFHRHVVAFLKMMMKKNKVGIVKQVLEEFERIYDELCGTQVVLVSSKMKLEEDELFGIAKSVQELSGAVRVKVRNLVEQKFPSFAV